MINKLIATVAFGLAVIISYLFFQIFIKAKNAPAIVPTVTIFLRTSSVAFTTDCPLVIEIPPFL